MFSIFFFSSVDARSSIASTLELFGESGKGTDEDAVKAFFSTIAAFARSFRQAASDNAAKLAELEKARARQDKSGANCLSFVCMYFGVFAA